jgi:hypothetical protein
MKVNTATPMSNGSAPSTLRKMKRNISELRAMAGSGDIRLQRDQARQLRPA